MEEKRDLKAMVPVVIQMMADGIPKNEALKSFNLPAGCRAQLRYHVERVLNPDPPSVEEEEKALLILPPKPHRKKYVVINGKKYRDITEEVIDCGG